jgi:hypothetical protein
MHCTRPERIPDAPWLDGGITAAAVVPTTHSSAPVVDLEEGGRVVLRPGGFHIHGDLQWRNTSDTAVGTIRVAGLGAGAPLELHTASGGSVDLAPGGVVTVAALPTGQPANFTSLEIYVNGALRQVRIDGSGNLFVA